jgi:hypothetical protein
MDGGIGSKNAGDRGEYCRTVTDAVTVFDVKGYESDDMFASEIPI